MTPKLPEHTVFCILALDVQNCGMGREGGEALRTLVDTNQTLEVVDLRRNPFVPEILPQQLITLLDHRHNQYSQQVLLYCHYQVLYSAFIG